MCAIAVFACMLALSLKEAQWLAVCEVASCLALERFFAYNIVRVGFVLS
jgi:hypothetical protein